MRVTVLLTKKFIAPIQKSLNNFNWPHILGGLQINLDNLKRDNLKSYQFFNIFNTFEDSGFSFFYNFVSKFGIG
jgi:hypothetical protein